MNKLLSEKKQTESKIDSLILLSQSENALTYKKDTTDYDKHLRVSVKAEYDAKNEEEKLKAINYSIDSLSKLK
jgi:uncharacterized membrane protein